MIHGPAGSGEGELGSPTPVGTFSYLRGPPAAPPRVQEWAVAASAQLVDAVDPRPRGSPSAVATALAYLDVVAVALGAGAAAGPVPPVLRRLAVVRELTGTHVQIVERRPGVQQVVISTSRRRSVLGALIHHPQRAWVVPVRREGDALLADPSLDLEQRSREVWLRLVSWCRDLRRATLGAGTTRSRGDRRRAAVGRGDEVRGGSQVGAPDGGLDVRRVGALDAPDCVRDEGADDEPDEPDEQDDGRRRVAAVIRRTAATALQMAADDLPDEATGVRLRWVLDGDVARLRAEPTRPKEFKRAGVAAVLRRIVIEGASDALLERMALSHELAEGRTKPWVERLLRPLVHEELGRVDGTAVLDPKQVSRIATSTYAILGQVIELRLGDTPNAADRRVLQHWAVALDRALRRVERPTEGGGG